MKCPYCKDSIHRNLTFSEILFPYRIRPELCYQCRTLFKKYSDCCCVGCGKSQSQPTLCQDCQEWSSQYPNYRFHHQALFHYNLGMKEWMYRYKFLGDYQLGRCFSLEIKQLLKGKNNRIVCPIPLSDERRKRRGFNQVTSLLQFAQIPYIELLEKKIETAPQSEKNRRERLQMAQPFRVDTSKIGEVKGKEILLFDDVYTTGRTMFHAADCFIELGYKKVTSASLAR